MKEIVGRVDIQHAGYLNRSYTFRRKLQTRQLKVQYNVVWCKGIQLTDPCSIFSESPNDGVFRMLHVCLIENDIFTTSCDHCYANEHGCADLQAQLRHRVLGRKNL